MALVRKGLSVREISEISALKESTKENIKIPREPLKNSKVLPVSAKAPFTIYRDPVASTCQHCKSTKHVKNSQQKTSASISTQTSTNVNEDLDSWLCSENPPTEYWKTLAEERRVALKETLDENKELCLLVEKLNQEIDRLNTIVSHADYFTKMFKLSQEQNSTTSDAHKSE